MYSWIIHEIARSCLKLIFDGQTNRKKDKIQRKTKNWTKRKWETFGHIKEHRKQAMISLNVINNIQNGPYASDQNITTVNIREGKPILWNCGRIMTHYMRITCITMSNKTNTIRFSLKLFTFIYLFLLFFIAYIDICAVFWKEWKNGNRWLRHMIFQKSPNFIPIINSWIDFRRN